MIILGSEQAAELLKLVTDATAKSNFDHTTIVTMPWHIEVTVWLTDGTYEKWQIQKVNHTVRVE